jgi:hypothetical protein
MLVHGLGSTGFFASRAFVPAFVIAALLRWGPGLPVIGDWGLLQAVTGGPSWFTSDWCLIILGSLAALELLAQHNTDARALLGTLMDWAKPAAAMASFMGVLTEVDRQAVEQILGPAMIPAEAKMLDVLPALAVAAAVVPLVVLRAETYRPLVEADEDDDIGLQGLAAWAEDAWSAIGPVLLVLVPLVAVVLVAVVVLVMLLLRWRAGRREASARHDCGACDQTVSDAALACGACGMAVQRPQRVGFFGQPIEQRVTDPLEHRLDLAEKKRCITCATRLGQRRVDQSCEVCSTEVFADPAFAQAYVQRVSRRAMWVVPVAALLAVVPVLGLIPAVVLYRLQLVAPFRRYLPRVRTAVMRWMIRLGLVLMVVLQFIPGAGPFAVGGLALVSFWAYKRAFVRLLPRAASRPAEGGGSEPITPPAGAAAIG